VGSSFKVFADTLESGGTIKALCVPGGAKAFSNTDLKKGTVYTEASKAGAKGLPFLKIMENGKMKMNKIFACLFNNFCGLTCSIFIFSFCIIFFLLSQGSSRELVRWCPVWNQKRKSN
jgi:aspartyl-tRNA synthetase